MPDKLVTQGGETLYPGLVKLTLPSGYTGLEALVVDGCVYNISGSKINVLPAHAEILQGIITAAEAAISVDLNGAVTLIDNLIALLDPDTQATIISALQDIKAVVAPSAVSVTAALDKIRIVTVGD